MSIHITVVYGLNSSISTVTISPFEKKIRNHNSKPHELLDFSGFQMAI
jgi:hypothetical protein